MAQKVSWTEVAWADLEDVADFISKDSPHYAAAFVREVQDAARTLNQLFERGRVVPEFGDPAIRELFVRDYRLIYKIKEGFVFIIAFIHGARDLQSLWSSGGR